MFLYLFFLFINVANLFFGIVNACDDHRLIISVLRDVLTEGNKSQLEKFLEYRSRNLTGLPNIVGEAHTYSSPYAGLGEKNSKVLSNKQESKEQPDALKTKKKKPEISRARIPVVNNPEQSEACVQHGLVKKQNLNKEKKEPTSKKRSREGGKDPVRRLQISKRKSAVKKGWPLGAAMCALHEKEHQEKKDPTCIYC